MKAVSETVKGRQVKMPRFSEWMLPEVVQPFWAALQAGEFITGAAARVGTYRVKGRRWIVACGVCGPGAAATRGDAA
jgi:hypothetical protein